MAGANDSDGATISTSYADVSVSVTAELAAFTGGLVGYNSRSATETASYWDTGTTGQSNSHGGAGKTTRKLQPPTSYTGIYANCNLNLDGITGNDDPWDFGSNRECPVPKYGGFDPAKQRRPAIHSNNWNAPVVGEPVVASLNVDDATGIAWQWQSTADGHTWANIAGATGASGRLGTASCRNAHQMTKPR